MGVWLKFCGKSLRVITWYLFRLQCGDWKAAQKKRHVICSFSTINSGLKCSLPSIFQPTTFMDLMVQIDLIFLPPTLEKNSNR